MQLLPKKFPNEIGLVGHTIVNYPDKATARKIIEILAANKVDLIELQIPFSEPIADGPIFAKANHEVIAQGLKIEECYDFMSEMTNQYDLPFVFMSYANIVFKQGYENFIKAAKKAGAKGAIVPDLPLDVATDYFDVCQAHEFAAISVVAPNISTKRLQVLSNYFDGFVYAVARAGVTGTKTTFDNALDVYLKTLRQFSDLPIAVGFGVSNREDLNFLRSKADYAVVGTQTIRSYEQGGLEAVSKLWQELSGCGKSI